MGQKKAQTVQCPSCGKVQSTDGKQQFICCHKNHNILDNLYRPENIKKEVIENDKEIIESDKTYTEERRLRDTRENQTSNGGINSDGSTENSPDMGERITFIGGNENMQESIHKDNEYNCQDCGSPLSKGQKYCPQCGKELNWEGIE